MSLLTFPTISPQHTVANGQGYAKGWLLFDCLLLSFDVIYVSSQSAVSGELRLLRVTRILRCLGTCGNAWVFFHAVRDTQMDIYIYTHI